MYGVVHFTGRLDVGGKRKFNFLYKNFIYVYPGTSSTAKGTFRPLDPTITRYENYKIGFFRLLCSHRFVPTLTGRKPPPSFQPCPLVPFR